MDAYKNILNFFWKNTCTFKRHELFITYFLKRAENNLIPTKKFSLLLNYILNIWNTFLRSYPQTLPLIRRAFTVSVYRWRSQLLQWNNLIADGTENIIRYLKIKNNNKNKNKKDKLRSTLLFGVHSSLDQLISY
jgi:hypothetical protein